MLQKRLCLSVFLLLFQFYLRYDTIQRQSKSAVGLKLKLKPQSCAKTAL